MIGIVQLYADPESDSDVVAVEVNPKVAKVWMQYCEEVGVLQKNWGFDQVRVPLNTNAYLVNPHIMWAQEGYEDFFENYYCNTVFVDGVDPKKYEVSKGIFYPAGWWLRVSEKAVQLWTYDKHVGREYESADIELEDLLAISEGRSPRYYAVVKEDGNG